MKILLTGGTGFIGKNLTKSGLFTNSEFIILSRTPDKFKEYKSAKIRFISSSEDVNKSEKIEAIINLAGENIAAKRWDSIQKQELIKSRLNTTEEILKIIKKLEQKPEVLISASAIGYYGSWNDENITEATTPKESFTHTLCENWEDAAFRANKSYGVKTHIIRLGVVLGLGGALAKMLPPFKLGLGGKIGNGKQYFSWVHVEDVVSAIKYLIDNKNLDSGVYNLTAPNPVTNHEFTKILGKALSRPTIFPMPEFVVKALFGEMGKTLLLEGQKVLPYKLEKRGFVFKYKTISSAINSIIKGNL